MRRERPGSVPYLNNACIWVESCHEQSHTGCLWGVLRSAMMTVVYVLDINVLIMAVLVSQEHADTPPGSRKLSPTPEKVPGI